MLTERVWTCTHATAGKRRDTEVFAVVVRRTAGTAVLAAAAALLAWAGPPTLSVSAAAGAVDQQIAAVAALAAWACLLWLAVGALAAAVAQLPGALGLVAGRVCARITPVVIRRAVEAAMGAAVFTSSFGASAVSALAQTSTPAPVASATAHAPSDPNIGDRPTRPAPPVATEAPPLADFDRPAAPPRATRAATPTPVPAAPDPPAAKSGTARLTPEQFVLPASVAVAPLPVLAGPPARPTTDANDEVVVRRGDTLWGIAARHLAADATAAEIDTEWRRWYAANRAAVGPDPDLIRPGLRLAPPG